MNRQDPTPKHLANYMNTKELKKITKFMRESGVLELKTPELTLVLSPAAIFPVKKQGAVEADDIKNEPNYTPEQILMWSAPDTQGDLQ